MFEEGYHFRYVNFKEGKKWNEPYIKEHLFTFDDKQNHRYIVRLQEFSYYFFAVKFHLKRDSHNPKKYEILTNYKDATRVIRTCIDIIIYLYKKNPYSSFGFIGNNSADEEKQNTTRFRVYKKVMENFFSLEKFYHFKDIKTSAYLLINRDNPDTDLFPKIRDMLLAVYDKSE
jgi:hypothetical protein